MTDVKEQLQNGDHLITIEREDVHDYAHQVLVVMCDIVAHITKYYCPICEMAIKGVEGDENDILPIHMIENHSGEEIIIQFSMAYNMLLSVDNIGGLQ